MNIQELEKLKAHISKISGENREVRREMNNINAEYKAFRKACENQPRSLTHELDSMPGRRIFYNFSQKLAFDINNRGQRAQPMSFLVSQDGPFIMTHYPLVAWRPSAPSSATLFGQFRPVSTWALPDQEIAGDHVNLSYEISDSGSGRNFQNLPSSAGPFSLPDNFVPVPCPTLFAPNTTIQFTPTFEDIFFDGTLETPTTAGILSVSLPGYRIINM